MEIPIIQGILAVFPEFLLIGYVGLGLLGIKIRLNKHLKIAGSCTIFLIIIRNIFKLYGIHVILGFLFLAVLFKVIVKLEWYIAIISALLGYIMLFLGEVVIMPLIFNWLRVDMVRFLNGDLIELLSSFYLAKLPLVIAAILIHLHDFSIINMEKEVEKLSN